MLVSQGKINVCGIYGIKNHLGVVKYIGGSGECNDAFSRHKSNLVAGEYFETNKHDLQMLFNNEHDDLIFYIVKECPKEQLDDMETKYINLYSKTIVNKDKKGKRRTSKPTPEETEKRRQVNQGENNPHCTKLKENDVYMILRLIDEKNHTFEKIAAIFGVSQTHVSNIHKGIKWSHVKEKYIKEKRVIN